MRHGGAGYPDDTETWNRDPPPGTPMSRDEGQRRGGGGFDYPAQQFQRSSAALDVLHETMFRLEQSVSDQLAGHLGATRRMLSASVGSDGMAAVKTLRALNHPAKHLVGALRSSMEQADALLDMGTDIAAMQPSALVHAVASIRLRLRSALSAAVSIEHTTCPDKSRKEVAQRVRWAHLVPFLLGQIFKHLPDVDMVAASSVCRSWRSACPKPMVIPGNHWRARFADLDQLVSNLLSDLSGWCMRKLSLPAAGFGMPLNPYSPLFVVFGSSITELHMKVCEDEWLSSIFESCPNLEIFDCPDADLASVEPSAIPMLVELHCQVDNEAMGTVMRVTTLKRLYLEPYAVTPMHYHEGIAYQESSGRVAVDHDMRAVDLIPWSSASATKTLIVTLLRRLPNLVELGFPGSALTQSEWAYLGGLPRLRSLVLSSTCDPMKPTVSSSYFRSLECLKLLAHDRTFGVSSAFLHPNIVSPELRVLSLQQCDITGSSVQVANLTNLSLVSCVCDPLPEILSEMPLLKHLHLESMPDTRRGLWSKIILRSSNLESLRVARMPSLRHLVVECPRLRVVDTSFLHLSTIVMKSALLRHFDIPPFLLDPFAEVDAHWSDPEASLTDMAVDCPNLVSLSVPRHDCIPRLHWSQMCISHYLLKDLHLNVCGDWPTLQHLSFPYLRSLHVVGDAMDVPLRFAFDTPQLRMLMLDSMAFNHSRSKSLFLTCTKLETVKLRRISGIRSITFDRHPNLRQLSIRELPEVRIVKLLSPRLHSLHATGCPEWAFFGGFVCPLVQEIHIKRCPLMSDGSFSAMAMPCSMLLHTFSVVQCAVSDLFAEQAKQYFPECQQLIVDDVIPFSPE